MGRDTRFDGMREKFFSFLKFWLLQGVSVFVVLLASILFWRLDATTTSTLSWSGLLIFVLGLALEATADYQKFLFKFSGQKKKHPWIDSGVWRMTRHPNYLGEMMVWSGLYLFVLPSLSGTAALWALTSPLYIIGLLMFVSGVPLLEKAADKKWGKQSAYQQYKSEVPVLIPTPSSIKRAVK
jgi:steroid 5-alpha reductase family enzyme